MAESVHGKIHRYTAARNPFERLLREFVDGYYHPVRTHRGLNGEPPIVELLPENRQLLKDVELEAEPILDGLYPNYRAKAA